MLVYYFVPFIVSNRYLLVGVSNGHNSVTVQNLTHVCMNFFHHKDLGNHLLQLCPKVVKHPVYMSLGFKRLMVSRELSIQSLIGSIGVPLISMLYFEFVFIVTPFTIVGIV